MYLFEFENPQGGKKLPPVAKPKGVKFGASAEKSSKPYMVRMKLREEFE